MKRLTALFAILCVLAWGWQCRNGAAVTPCPQPTVCTIQNSEAATKQPQNKFSLTAGNGFYRTPGSRSQRVMPTYGSKQGKGAGRLVSVFRQQCRAFWLSGCGWPRVSTAPVRSGASCDYYVIALRHIIR